MEDWIVLDDDKSNTVYDEMNNVNHLISQLDNDIKNKSYESASNKPTNSNYITKEKNNFLSCFLTLNGFCLQVKTLQFYILSTFNDFKRNLY